jgi:hypothetical protein
MQRVRNWIVGAASLLMLASLGLPVLAQGSGQPNGSIADRGDVSLLPAGLLAPRFAPSQRAYVLSGLVTAVNPAVPASTGRDVDNR